jgi:hypothetical protein
MRCQWYGVVAGDSQHSYGCELDGWDQLFNLCPDHFREKYLLPTYLSLSSLEAKYFDYQSRLYHVEVARGDRPRPSPSWRSQGKTQPQPRTHLQTYRRLQKEPLPGDDDGGELG